MDKSPAELFERARHGDATAAEELLKLALCGDATATAHLWRAIDASKVPDSVALAWLRDLAAHVLAKMLPTGTAANRRAEKARAVLGLEGRVDKNVELADLVDVTMQVLGPEVKTEKIVDFVEVWTGLGGSTRVQVVRKIDYIRKKKSKK